MEIPLLQEQEHALSALETAMQEIRDGQCINAMVFQLFADGRYSLSGGACIDKHEMAGMLLEAAIRRLIKLPE